MAQLVQLTPAPGYWLNPGGLKVPGTDTPWRSLFPDGLAPRFESKADFEDLWADDLVPPPDPREDIVTFRAQLEAYERQLIASQNYAWAEQLQICTVDLFYTLVGSWNCEDLTPNDAGLPPQLYATLTNQRNDTNWQGVYSLGGCVIYCDGEPTEVMNGGYSYETFVPPNVYEPHEFVLCNAMPGSTYAVYRDCVDVPGGYYDFMPINEPPPMTLPEGVPPPPGTTGTPPVLTGSISYDDQPGPGYVEMVPMYDDDGNPGQEMIFHLPDPCTQDDCDETPPRRIPRFFPPEAPPGAVPTLDEEGNVIFVIMEGGGVCELEAGVIKRAWVNPETGETEPREVEVHVPASGAASTKTLFNEILLMLEELQRGMRPQVIVAEQSGRIEGPPFQRDTTGGGLA